MPTLGWIGKEKVINHHQDVPFRTLQHEYGFADGTKQDNQTGSGNKIIHGDNLEALKSLLPEYESKIKCIYIDPPYNTGNESWVYNDNVNHPKIKKWLGQVVGKEGEDLSRHDKWLCMMYPRLKLLHKLLSDDGAIFISIGDDEHANLKLLCDEVFGSSNIAGVISRTTKRGGNAGKYFSHSVDYVLVYTKNITTCKPFKTSISDNIVKTYKLSDENGKFKWRNWYDSSLTLERSRNARYGIISPDGSKIFPPEGKRWRNVEPTFLEKLDKGDIEFRKVNNPHINEKGESSPWGVYYKLRLGPPHKNSTVPDNIIDTALNSLGTNILSAFKIPFNFSKPVELIIQLINFCTFDPKEENIILDSFSGSGTTAHAVLNLNKEDGGNRKFILIEMEDYADSITAERVKRVINGYGESKNAVPGTGGSFDYYTMGDPLFIDENLNEKVDDEVLAEYIRHIETG